MRTEDNDKMILDGKLIPGVTYGSERFGIVWVVGNHTDEAAFKVRELLRQIGWNESTVHESNPWSDEIPSEIQFVVSVDTFFALVSLMSVQEEETSSSVSQREAVKYTRDFAVGRSLTYYIHVLRLAGRIVDEQDVTAFAVPVETPWADVLDVCFAAASQEEEGLGKFASGKRTFAVGWAPLWRDESVRALRLLLVSFADELCIGSSAQGTTSGIATDITIWCCLQWLMSRFGDITTRQTDFADGPYRVRYQGEDELFMSWRAALCSSVHTMQADGWLVWRTLRTLFVGSGWKTAWLTDRSGRSYYHLAAELQPPILALSPEWRLSFYVVHNLFSIRKPLLEWWQQPSRNWNVGKEILICPDIWMLPLLKDISDVLPVLKAAMQQTGVSDCVLPSQEVYNFLMEDRWKLEKMGVTIEIPSMEQLQAKDLRIHVQVRSHRSKRPTKVSTSGGLGVFTTEQLVDFDWTVVIGDKELSASEFEQMVERDTPFVEIGGTWKLVPVQSILEQVEAFRGGRQGTRAAMSLFGAVLGASEEEDSPSVEVSFEDESADMQGLWNILKTSGKPELPPVPIGFHGTLRAYQHEGFGWLVHLRKAGCGALLADDMGLGKTIQVLALLQHIKETQNSKGTHLLICPTSLLNNWRAEFQRFTPGLSVYVHHGSNRNEQDESGRTPLEVACSQSDVIVTTYATVIRDEEHLLDIHWDVVVVDEAQNVKNPNTRQSRVIAELKARQRIALTGTPLENKLEELWSIVQFVNPGYLGKLSWFRKTFATQVSAGETTSTERLHRLLKPILLRRNKSDPSIQLELPEKWEYIEYAALSSEQAALYQSVVNQLFQELPDASGMSRKGRVLAALVRLKQICDHPCLVTGGLSDAERSGKLSLLLDLLDSVLEEQESALVFTQFRDMGVLLCDVMEKRFGWRPSFLHGGLRAAERGSIVDTFQSGEKNAKPVLVLSLKAGGVGLNLTRANHVFHFDRWWNPAVEDQATDRVFRIGQTKDVQVHKLVCPGTLEERIDELIRSKRFLSSAVVGKSEGWITELDNQALETLFSLNHETALGDES